MIRSVQRKGTSAAVEKWETGIGSNITYYGKMRVGRVLEKKAASEKEFQPDCSGLNDQ